MGSHFPTQTKRLREKLQKIKNQKSKMGVKIITNSSRETKKLGKVLAEDILKRNLKKQAFVIGLIGDLGGGKTTFLQGFAKELGIRTRILSPTFVIIKRFEIQNSRFKNFYHIDCYRIEKPKEILKLGFADIIKDPQNIVAIEWAEKIQKILPKEMLILKFKFLEKNKREIKISGYPTVDNYLLTRFLNLIK